VANKPILFYGIEAVRDAGIEEVGIVVGDTERDIREAVGDGARFGVRVEYIRQEEPLGLAHAVLVSKDFLGEEPFVMYLGDNLIRGGITDLVSEFRQGGYNSQILLARVKNPSSFGVAELDGDRVVGLEEKPKQPKSDMALVGVYMFDRNVFEAVGAIRPSWRHELEITDAIQYLIDHGFDVHSHVVRGWWKDTGKLEDMLEANRMLTGDLRRRIEGEVDGDSRLEGDVVVEAGARVHGSVLRGPLILGKETLVERSYVGPFTSVYDRTRIEGSEIENSIVLDRCVIRNVDKRIESSLIGNNVVIEKGDHRPQAYRFMVGDNSRMTLI
jgi:glucose-1-phosphate thymidylyltransferase